MGIRRFGSSGEETRLFQSVHLQNGFHIDPIKLGNSGKRIAFFYDMGLELEFLLDGMASKFLRKRSFLPTGTFIS